MVSFDFELFRISEWFFLCTQMGSSTLKYFHSGMERVGSSLHSSGFFYIRSAVFKWVPLH